MDSDASTYLTADSVTQINQIITGSDNITLRKAM